MSARVYRKLHGADLKLPKASKQEEEEEQEEEDTQSIEKEEEVVVEKSKNVFDLLKEEDEEQQQEEEQEGEDWLEESKASTSAKPSTSKSPASSKKSKKKKKKKSSKTPHNPEKEEEDIDELIKQYADASVQNRQSSPQVSDTPTIFSLNTKCLNPDMEMVRLFGKKTMNQVAKSSGGARRNVHRKTLLIKPRDTWPKVPYGVSMEFLESKNGLNYFKTVWTEDYRRLQQEFFQVVQTHDPNNFNYLLMKNPYHLDSLLQLSEFLKKVGEFDSAKDFVDRSVYCFECAWHTLFNPVPGNCRLDYAVEENRTFFLALFREIQSLGREGCSRTALEYCKLLLSLDPSDPLSILFLVDSFCIRSDQFEYLIELYGCPELEDKHLFTLPNFSFSVALAKFHIEQSKAKLSKPLTEFNKVAAKLFQTSSDELLQQAILLFPMVVPALLKKCSVSFVEKESDGAVVNLANHGFFTDTYCPVSLKHLVTLYVERNYNLWKSQEVIQWLKKNAKAAIQRVHTNDPMVKNFEAILKDEYVDTPKNIFNHLLLSEHTDAIEALPPELLHNDGGAQLHDAYFQQPPVIHAPTNNPLGLFFQSLFNPQIPNAPALENADQLAWYHQLLQYLGPQPDDQQQQGGGGGGGGMEDD